MAECPINGSEIYNLNKTESYKFQQGPRITVSIILPVMASLRMLFNLLFLSVVYRAPKMRTLINVFLAQLAFCDFCTLVFDTTRYLWIYIRSSGYDIIQGRSAGCTIFNFLFYYTYFVGVNFICLISIERYFAICQPIAHRNFKGKNRARKLSIACWSIAFLLSIAALVPQKVVTICAQVSVDETSLDYDWKVFRECRPYELWLFHILYINDTLQFMVVLTITVFLYFLIIRQLQKRESEQMSSSTPGSTPSAISRVSRDVTRMLIINAIAFFTFLGPYQIWNVILLIWDYTGVLVVSQEFLYWIGWIARLCAPINFSINPLIYGVSNRQYRRAFTDVFGCKAKTDVTDSEMKSNKLATGSTTCSSSENRKDSSAEGQSDTI